MQEAKVQKDNFNTITAAIKPVLDCIDIEPAPVLTAGSKGQTPSFRDARQRGRISKTSTATPF